MKVLKIAIVLISTTIQLTGSHLFAQNVYIPDSIFKAFLVGNSSINTNGDTSIQVSEANVFTGQIFIKSKNISDLTGIEYFTSLGELNCSDNQISTLDVSNNIKLKTLYCNDNELTTLKLGNNSILNYLYCSNNKLTTLDISNTDLIKLGCSVNNLTSLDVSNNANLSYLFCSENELTSLNVSNNAALIHIDCRDNKLPTIDVSSCSLLSAFYCKYNNLTALDVTNNTKITTLRCDNNQLTTLNVSNNYLISNLNCSDNKITTLDLSNNPLIQYIWCNYNQLTYLNLKNGNNTYIKDLYAINYSYSTCIEVDDVDYSTANWTSISSDAFFSTDCSTTNIFNISPFIDLTVAPIPFSQRFTVSIPGVIDINEAEIYLFDMIGKKMEVVYTKSNNEININASSINPGIYILELVEQGKVMGRMKVIKHPIK